MRIRLGLTFLAAILLASCAKNQPASGASPHATVMMRDGSSMTGAVVSSSAAEIQLQTDDKVLHTIPMAQVRSVDYGEAAPAAPTQAAVPPAEAADPVHDQHQHALESAITTKTFTLPVGTQIPVRNEETIDSAKAVEGQIFAAEVTRDVHDEAGAVVIPRGANAQIVIRSATKGGKIHGASDLVLDLASVSIDGRRYSLSTVDIHEKGHDGVGANKRTAEFAGGGAAIGAVIGALAGHGKGAAIGAGSGAGAGTLTEVLTKGHSIKVPVESILPFKLDRPLRVTAQ